MSVEDFALSFVNEVLKEKKDVKSSFKARTKDLYSMAYFNGIVPTLAFAYSKAKEKNVKEMLEGAKKEDIKDEDKGYALYTLAIVKYLKEVEKFVKINGEIDSLIELIKKDEERLTNKILVLMNWLKLFAEAKIES
jgi:CRISPR type III-B/RAMP module-associated protein Cmr5